MRLALKYRAYPTSAQITRIENSFSMCRHLFNWNLQERIEVYQKEGRSVSYYDQQNALPDLKKEKPWFKGVYSLVLQDVLRRLDGAFQKFFKEKIGFPKFKKKGQWNSITYTDHRKRPEDGFLEVSKIGRLKIVYHREIPENAEIKTLSIIKEGDKWFACFSVELPDPPEFKCQLATAIGIDLGLQHFVYTSDKQSVESPKELQRKLKDLKRLQRKLSKTPKRTAQYYKVLKALQKVYYRIPCKRDDFLYKTARGLLLDVDLIVHENLNILPMLKRPELKLDEESNQYLPNGASRKANHHRAILDAAWRKFLSILAHVAKKLGKLVIGVDPKLTSQTCSNCREIVWKALSTRTHNCPHCHYKADRDENAAINILRLGLESLGIPLEALNRTLCV